MLQYFLTWLRTMRREEGQDLGEYALLLGVIAIVIVGVIIIFRDAIANVFERVTGVLQTAGTK